MFSLSIRKLFIRKPKVFFFVHIPKTAGTSFRRTLEKKEKVAMFYDYGEKDPESNKALLDKVRGTGYLSDTLIFSPDKLNVICGHVYFKKYAPCVKPQNVLAIMRNPIERLVSEYQHLVRHRGFSKSFSQFISSPGEINKQYKWLKGISVSSGSLIGLTSHYGSFLALASQRMGVRLEPTLLNKAPPLDVKKRHAISPSDINKAFELNQKDLALFRSVAKSFSGLLRQFGVKTTPEVGRKYNCRIDRARRIVGWVGSSDRECFFVTLMVNKKFRAIVGLDQPRKQIANGGLSENEICGFSYPLFLLGANPGDQVEMKLLGARQFRKTVVVPQES
jgi:hypothetical protein